MSKILAEGLHPGVPMMDYVNDLVCPEPSISKGVIDRIVNRSPLHAHHEHPRLGGKKQDGSSRADLGSAAHDYLLGGDQGVEFVDYNDWRTKDAKAQRDAIRANNAIPMLEKDRYRLDEMSAAARERLEDFGPGDTEHVLLWSEDGTWMRTRPDWISEDRRVVIDYKTAKNADPISWIKSSLNGTPYDIGASLVLRGLGKVFGKSRRDFYWLVQEIEPPFACSLVGPGPEMLELAERKIEAGLRVWRECMERKQWPGYDSRIHWAEVPQYQVWDFENRPIAHPEVSV